MSRRSIDIHMTASVSRQRCTGCGACSRVCPAVFELADRTSRVKVEKVPLDAEASCLTVMESCPAGAISLGLTDGPPLRSWLRARARSSPPGRPARPEPPAQGGREPPDARPSGAGNRTFEPRPAAGPERRASGRFGLDLAVRVRPADLPYAASVRGRTCEVALGGLGLELDQIPCAQREICMEFNPAPGSYVLQLNGRIVWMQPASSGLRAGIEIANHSTYAWFHLLHKILSTRGPSCARPLRARAPDRGNIMSRPWIWYRADAANAPLGGRGPAGTERR